jgi:Raf kinase inhibitor-like YbhB/YbcL family protein
MSETRRQFQRAPNAFVGPSYALNSYVRESEGRCMAFTLTSSAFGDGDTIPREFTCDGEDLAPPLAWSDAPEGTRSFALVMEDPDAARGTFTHWLLYDIPATTTVLYEQAGAKALCNGFHQADYGGPCPPLDDGPHRYVFTLHAVDVPSLGLYDRTRQALECSLHTHTLATAQLVGRYERRS